MPRKRKLIAARVEALKQARKKRAEKVPEKPKTDDLDAVSEEEAYVPPPEVLTRTIDEFFKPKESRPSRSAEAAGEPPGLIGLDEKCDPDSDSESSDDDSEDRVKDDCHFDSSADTSDESSSESDEDDVLLDKDKDGWQRTRNSHIRVFVRLGGKLLNVPKVIVVSRRYGPRSRGRRSLNEAQLANQLQRGTSGGRRPAVIIPNERQINRQNNAEQHVQKKLEAQQRRDQVMAQIKQAQSVLDKALNEVTLKARVEVVYDVEKGEKMASVYDFV